MKNQKEIRKKRYKKPLNLEDVSKRENADTFQKEDENESKSQMDNLTVKENRRFFLKRIMPILIIFLLIGIFIIWLNSNNTYKDEGGADPEIKDPDINSEYLTVIVNMPQLPKDRFEDLMDKIVTLLGEHFIFVDEGIIKISHEYTDELSVHIKKIQDIVTYINSKILIEDKKYYVLDADFLLDEDENLKAIYFEMFVRQFILIESAHIIQKNLNAMDLVAGELMENPHILTTSYNDGLITFYYLLIEYYDELYDILNFKETIVNYVNHNIFNDTNYVLMNINENEEQILAVFRQQTIKVDFRGMNNQRYTQVVDAIKTLIENNVNAILYNISEDEISFIYRLSVENISITTEVIKKNVNENILNTTNYMLMIIKENEDQILRPFRQVEIDANLKVIPFMSEEIEIIEIIKNFLRGTNVVNYNLSFNQITFFYLASKVNDVCIDSIIKYINNSILSEAVYNLTNINNVLSVKIRFSVNIDSDSINENTSLLTISNLIIKSLGSLLPNVGMNDEQNFIYIDATYLFIINGIDNTVITIREFVESKENYMKLNGYIRSVICLQKSVIDYILKFYFTEVYVLRYTNNPTDIIGSVAVNVPSLGFLRLSVSTSILMLRHRESTPFNIVGNEYLRYSLQNNSQERLLREQIFIGRVDSEIHSQIIITYNYYGVRAALFISAEALLSINYHRQNNSEYVFYIQLVVVNQEPLSFIGGIHNLAYNLGFPKRISRFFGFFHHNLQIVNNPSRIN